MGEKELLIVGIDPGVTVAYSIFNIDGRPLKSGSSKSIGIKEIISESMEFGKVIAVGTDKSKVPGFVDSFAAKLGAEIFSPKEDLKVNEKKSMSNNFDFANDHEMDAIASAVFAYKNIKPLIDKVNFYCDKNNKSPIRKRVLELVILKKISIKNAVAVAEKKDEPSKVIDKVISEKKIEEKDFIRIFDALKKSESEIRILKEYNNRLNNEIKKIKSAPKRLITSKNAPDFRERRILSLENSLLAKQKELEKFRGIVQRLNSFISRINDFYILKKLDSLGITEVEHKNKILNIRKNDILLVEDANIFSQKSVDMLKDKVDVIVCRAPISKKIENDLPFIFLNASKLKINEDKYFAFADKKQLEMEKDKSGWVKKVIEDYKREKEIDY